MIVQTLIKVIHRKPTHAFISSNEKANPLGLALGGIQLNLTVEKTLTHNYLNTQLFKRIEINFTFNFSIGYIFAINRFKFTAISYLDETVLYSHFDAHF